MITGYDIWKVMSPRRWAQVPSGTTSCSRFVKSRKSETPRIISGTTNESSITKFAERAGRPCQRSMPIAKAVPSGTATSTVTNESLKVCIIAARRLGSWKSESKGSPFHHRSENPCHVLRDRPALNEKITAIATGTSDQNR